MKRQIKNSLFVMLVSGFLFFLPAQAATPDKLAGYNTAPDNMAWTIALPVVDSKGETIDVVVDNYNTMQYAHLECWWPNGYEVVVGALKYGEETPGEGQHFYAYRREKGINPVYKWVCQWEKACCQHKNILQTGRGRFHGLEAGNSRCGRGYYSGWVPYCADCGNPITTMYHYMDLNTVRQIDALDTTMGYYYLCPRPSCRGMEQAREYTNHLCKGVSANRYKVVYHYDTAQVRGNLKYSLHMYNNDPFYEGEKAVNVQTKLNRVVGMHAGSMGERTDALVWPGHLFAGWAVEPNGPVVYQDGAEIRNLTKENYDGKNETKGVVHLYAVWKEVESTLQIDAAGGKYDGQQGGISYALSYNETKLITKNKLTPPKGYTVRFRTNGGRTLNDMQTEKVFSHWKEKNNLQGFFVNDGDSGTYVANSVNFVVDVIAAEYQNGGIRLPQPEKDGCLFCGWCRDEACSDVVGMAGDFFVPEQDTVLFAKWGDLKLTAVPNYTDNQGQGAIDLFWQWNQPVSEKCFYMPYQSQNTAPYRYQMVHSAIQGQDMGESIGKKVYTKEGTYTFTVPSTGYYEVTACGAKGGDYKDAETNTVYTGGKGGKIGAKVYLKKGQKVTVKTGGTGNGQQGGACGGGNGGTKGAGGGGYSAVWADDTLLVMAGGGGGASVAANGGAGGAQGEIVGSYQGQNAGAVSNGAGGGGGGYTAGSAGKYEKVYHSHNASCDFHVHTGNSQSQGGCYTEKISGWKLCGNVEWIYMTCDAWWDYENNRCIRCWGTDPNYVGHRDAYCYNAACLYHDISFGQSGWSESEALNPDFVYAGNWFWQDTAHETATYVGKHYIWSVSGWKRNCGYEREGYQCGLEGTVERYTAVGSMGGSNYRIADSIATLASQAGVWNAEGYVSVEAVSVGLVDEQLSLKGIPARDEAAPEPVAVQSVVQKEQRQSLLLTFDAVRDRGTAYLDYVKAYRVKNNAYIVSSNTTPETVLTVGLKGYYYQTDGASGTKVTPKNASFTEENAIRITGELYEKLKRGEQLWLHIAAADRNENLSDTVHVALGAESVTKQVFTEGMRIKKSQDAVPDNVLDTGDGKTYFVKADGKTPFFLEYEGFVSAMEQTYLVPDLFQYRLVGSGTGTISLEWSQPQAGQTVFAYSETGEIGFLTGGNCEMHRQASGKTTISQDFTASGALDGQAVTVYPTAGYRSGQQLLFSSGQEDKKQALTLLLDGQAPYVEGLEELKEWCQDYKRTDTLHLDLKPQDTGSGVASMRIRITTREGILLLHEETETGVYHFFMSGQEKKNAGDFTVCLEVTDKVGNRGVYEIEGGGYGIQASLERVLAPHEPIFRQGESGRLYLTVSSKVDKLQIVFPSALTSLAPELNQVAEFPGTGQDKSKSVLFQIPIGTPDSDLYEVEIYSYSEGELLEEEPVRCPFEVHGSILDDLRTRLR